MKVTDEMARKVCRVYYDHTEKAPDLPYYFIQNMKAALEAVFNHTGEATEEVEPEYNQEKPFCSGKNCKATKENLIHSRECLFEHFMSYTGSTKEMHDELQRAYFDGMDAVPNRIKPDTVKPEKQGCGHSFNKEDECANCSEKRLREIYWPAKQTLMEFIKTRPNCFPTSSWEVLQAVGEYLEKNNVV